MLRLSVRARLVGLLVAAVVAIIGILLATQYGQRRAADLLSRDREVVAQRTFERIVDMKEQTLDLHARDYSIWDEFVAFLEERDSSWAEVNLRQNAASFPMDVSWALDPDLEPVFAARFVPGPALPRPPVPTERLRRALTTRWFQHFFVRTDEGLLETWIAPVQPSKDAQRVTRPHGWYVIGRWWGPRLLADLSSAADGQVSVVDVGRGGPREPGGSGTVVVDRILPDVEGRPLAIARLRQPFPMIGRLERDSRQKLLLMGLAHAAMLVVAGLCISRWVTRPLETLRSALRSEQVADLDSLRGHEDEFGRLADLVAKFFEQREALVGEIGERRRVQQDLVRQKDLVRQAIDTIPDPVLVVDKRDRVVLINENALRRFAPGRTQVVGEDVREVLEPLGCADGFERLRTQSLLVGGPVTEEHELLLPEGARRFRTSHCPLWLPEGDPLILAISEDVTELVDRAGAAGPPEKGEGDRRAA